MAETGHARNVGHFATLISFVQGYGDACEPCRTSGAKGQNRER